MLSYSESTQNEISDQNNLFMNDFKFYRRLKDLDPDQNTEVIILDKLKTSNLKDYNLKVKTKHLYS